jgi:hypothetical protein
MALNLDTLGLSATVTAQGISAPDYQTILDTVTGYFQQIYGTDAYLDPDSKDGQMVALVALAIHDANTTAINVYNSFSPSTALTDALTRNVKINGIARKGKLALRLICFFLALPEPLLPTVQRRMQTALSGICQPQR